MCLSCTGTQILPSASTIAVIMQSPVVVLLLALCVGLSYASGGRIRSRRLVGGSLARNIPWQVLVNSAEGGALISERWILTSGRNLFVNKTWQPTPRAPADLPKVYLGITKRRTLDPAQAAEVEKVVLHPDFQKNNSWDNNLALIKLKEPAVISETVQPIPLAGVGQALLETVGTQGVVSGWGRGALFTYSELLKYLVVPVVDQTLCQAEFEREGGRAAVDTPHVDERTFCTGITSLQENVCYGDEGGALAVLDPRDGRTYAAGILSFDKSCRAEKYAVYTRVSAYQPWILSVIRGDAEDSDAVRTAAMRQMLDSV